MTYTVWAVTAPLKAKPLRLAECLHVCLAAGVDFDSAKRTMREAAAESRSRQEKLRIIVKQEK